MRITVSGKYDGVRHAIIAIAIIVTMIAGVPVLVKAELKLSQYLASVFW